MQQIFKQRAEILMELSQSLEKLCTDHLANKAFDYHELSFLQETSRRLLNLACQKDETAKALEDK